MLKHTRTTVISILVASSLSTGGTLTAAGASAETKSFLIGYLDLQSRGNRPMKLKTIALASAFALSSTFAFAQGGGANGSGAAVPEKSGPAVNGGSGVVGNGNMQRGKTAGMKRRTMGQS